MVFVSLKSGRWLRLFNLDLPGTPEAMFFHRGDAALAPKDLARFLTPPSLAVCLVCGEGEETSNADPYGQLLISPSAGLASRQQRLAYRRRHPRSGYMDPGKGVLRPAEARPSAKWIVTKTRPVRGFLPWKLGTVYCPGHP